MDALSQMLLTMRLRGASFVVSDPESRSYLPPAPRALEATPMQGSERVMAFHLVAEGRCVTWLPGGEPIELFPGDLALFPVVHTLGPFDLRRDGPDSMMEHSGFMEAPGVFTLGRAESIYGYIECDKLVASLLLCKTPKVLHIKSSSTVTIWLQALMTACKAELNAVRVGSSIVAERMVELMLLEAIRRYVIENAATERPTEICQQS